MVEININTLRKLHQDSDRLRDLFYNMHSSEDEPTSYTLKNKDHVLSGYKYKEAARLALLINNCIIDIDAENTKNNNTDDDCEYKIILEKLLEHLKDLEMKYHERMEIASNNVNFNLYSKYNDLYNELASINGYIDDLSFKMKYR